MDGHGSGAGVDVAEHEEEHIHLPGPSIWPFGVGFFLFVAMVGLMFFPHYGTSASLGRWIVTIVITAVGAIGMGWSIVAWGVQISEA